MALRFRKTIKIVPGVRINFGKKSMSLSLGGRGGSLNINKNGLRSTVGIPGTGISYTSNLKSSNVLSGIETDKPDYSLLKFGFILFMATFYFIITLVYGWPFYKIVLVPVAIALLAKALAWFIKKIKERKKSDIVLSEGSFISGKDLLMPDCATNNVKDDDDPAFLGGLGDFVKSYSSKVTNTNNTD